MGMYDDIINLPYNGIEGRPRMSMKKRAAQFAAFAPFDGYDTLTAETARVTEERIVLSEDQINCINIQLVMLSSRKPTVPKAEFTYFVPDDHKEGGSYVMISGYIHKIDSYTRTVILRDGTRIPIDDLVNIESEAWGD